ncbi:MAG: type II secretion system F family protein [Deltaproteobacteria bacterium]|nr:type II secretion system F family protein [Deltaproteobacteria bacterium]MBW1954481.1 type II secretion system F family protein [Deltaproteobacteria bacterium]MBW2042140.1 type II secretion system F family protein [Deltaproteobacteria bacterium]MBW2132019.1 type II secretion system F family protein [Deltaproteobacteria bacterium]
MPVFQWEGRNRRNELQRGEMEALNAEVVRANLARLRITPVKIKKKPKDLFENVSFLQPQVRESDIILFARQFSTMIDAGLPIVQCLDILHTQQENKTFKKMLRQIMEMVEGGSTLAEALGRFPKHFDDLFVNMIAAGEAGGILDTILRRLAAYLEKAAKLKRRVKGAMTYPIIVLIIAVLVVAVILIFVIPVFSEMFSDLGGQLPLATQMVIDLSNFVKANVLYIAIAIALLAYAFHRFYKTEKGRIAIDKFVLKIPIIGILIRKVAVARFSRTMGTMLASGVAILEALDIVAKTAGNKTIENAIYTVRTGIAEGRTMADPLMETNVFPSMVCQMIAVGESTGALDAMLNKIADFYDEEVDQAVENLTAMIEPFMMVFLGITIGGLVISMYLPIFKMAGLV